MIAVAIEAAVIFALVMKLRRHNDGPRRVVWDEPMPWMDEEKQ
ncbi:MAG: hypothetical protein ABFD96_05845 [Armatimonadia bacterium]